MTYYQRQHDLGRTQYLTTHSYRSQLQADKYQFLIKKTNFLKSHLSCMYDLSNLCFACVFLTTLINSVYARKLLLMLILCLIIIVACEEWYINKINNNLLTGESIHLLHDEACS